MLKNRYLAICSSKTIARIKKFKKYDPPKVGFLRPKKVLGGQKSFLGPPKIKKIDFLKKPEFCDLSEHGGDQGSGPSPPDGVGPLGSIR